MNAHGKTSSSSRSPLPFRHLALAALLALGVAGCQPAETRPAQAIEERSALVAGDGAATAVPGVDAARLTPGYWIQRSREPDAVVLDAQAITAQNARLMAQDPSVADLDASFSAPLSRADVQARIEALSATPQRSLYDSQGQALDEARIRGLRAALALDALPEAVEPVFALVTRRADLRTFPTTQPVFSRPGDTDIDRFQESALFPGTPVVILHSSRDGAWHFIASRLYSAWIEADAVARGSRSEVLGYATSTPYLVVTGAQARTVYTPEQPAVSDLMLDMGVRLPLYPDWPAGRPVNGQLAYASHIVVLPVRNSDGMLDFVPALVPRSADVRTDYLPLTRAHLIGQAFKFLGERYGWGHSWGTRDCSGFVSEVYRSFGVEMPRNTRDQGISTAFDRIEFTPGHDYTQRLSVLRTLDVGDLIYIPGHVMMVIGQEDGEIWLIHDTTGIRYRNANGELVQLPLNQVAVTPLIPLLGDDGTAFIERIYSVQRIRAISE